MMGRHQTAHPTHVLATMEHRDDNSRGRPPGPLVGILATLLLVVGAIVVGVWWSQDLARSAAMRGPVAMGFSHQIQGGRGGSPSSHSFRANRPVLSDADVDAFIDHVAVLTRPYDLGLSEGEVIALIDLSATTASPAAVDKLRRAFPNADVRPPAGD